ncbi:MAG: energy-coupling factor ABC transporter permease [Kiritimatiellia bacterium]|jgi:cobalt/nickel transport system permease protein
MHVPSEMLSGPICPVSSVVAVLGVGAATVALFRNRDQAPRASRFAWVAAAVFGLQMLNYPVWSGISGHLIGGVFAAALLGVPAGVLATSVVLVLQTLLFADGGLTMLGANVVNMALLGAGAGGLLRVALMRRGVSDAWATGLAAAASVELAALSLALQLAIGSTASAAAIGLLVAVHAALAAVEGVATVVLVRLCATEPASAGSRKGYAVLAGLVLICLAAAPFASAFPDAFEWTMERFNLLPDAPNFVRAPFGDYSIGAIANEMASTFVAGVVGVLAVMAASFVLMSPFAKRDQA